MKARAFVVLLIWWAFLFTIAVSSVSPAAAYSGETAPRKLTVAYPSIGPFLLQFFLEKELGLFREEGLSPEFVLVRGGGLSTRGLIAGNFDYVTNVGSITDAAIRTELRLRVILTTALARYSLVTQPDIRSVTGLKGKKIAVSSLGGDSDLIAREILRRNSLDPLKDATFLVVGASRDRFAALISGSVHAALLSPPHNFKAMETGYREIAKAGDYVQWPITGLATREEKIQREPQEVSKIVRAWLKGIKLYVTQRDYLVSKIMHRFNLGREEAIETYESTRDTSIPSGYPSEGAQRTLISIIKQAANVTEEIPLERIFDNRFAKQAEQELRGWQPQIPR